MAINCSNCSLRSLCVPLSIEEEDLTKLDQLVRQRKKLKKNEFLYYQGDRFDSIFAIRTGFFKTVVTNPDGLDRILSFSMSGELLGLDGFSNNTYQSNSVALEDSEVCIINQSDIYKLSSSFQPLQYYLQKILSSEIVRENNLLMVISHLNAEDKILAFLINLGQRFKQRHYAEDQFYLRMSREDIGSYLNLKIETISRAFKKLEMRGLLEVSHKHVKIKNLAQIKDHLWTCNH